MRIALIAPPYPLEEVPSPPLGICYVAAACEAAGAEVKIFDYIVSRYSPEKLKAQLDEFCPDVVGTTSVTLNFTAAARILCTAKSFHPDIITIMGGPHVTFHAEETLRAYPGIDVVFLGEAENTLRQWIPRAFEPSSWGGIKGLAFKRQGEFVSTGRGDFIEDLDALPFPSRHLLPLSRYQALGFPISIITSRGCPNKCIFCLGRKMVGFKVRYRDPKLIVDEIETLVNMGFDIINIADDLFTANKKRVAMICEEIIKRDIRFLWSAFARVDTVSREVLELMKKAGCSAVGFGIESGNPEMLKRVKKGITVDQARQAVALCREVGMRVHASFMVGLPGETRQTLQDSLNLVRELDIEHGYHFLSPFPGTDVREQIKDFDLQILTDDWERYDANSAIVQTSALTPEEMNAFALEACRPMTDKWEKTQSRVKAGNATDAERLEVECSDRLNLIFEILSKDMIEEAGVFAQDGQDPVLQLSGEIARRTGGEPDFISRYIRLWMEKGFLAVSSGNGTVTWSWAPSALPLAGATRTDPSECRIAEGQTA